MEKSVTTKFGGIIFRVVKEMGSGSRSNPVNSSTRILNFRSPDSILSFPYRLKRIVSVSPISNFGVIATESIFNEGVIASAMGSSQGFNSLAGLRPSFTILAMIHPCSLPSKIPFPDLSTNRFSISVIWGGGTTQPHWIGDNGPSSPS